MTAPDAAENRRHVERRYETPAAESAEDRRAGERRRNMRILDLTLPEMRRLIVTSLLFLIVCVMFLWMVRTVIIGAILGAVMAVYLRPMYEWLRTRFGGRQAPAAILTVVAVLLPVIAVMVYSYIEIRDVADYVARNQSMIVAKIDAAAKRLPGMENVNLSEAIRRSVLAASNYGARLPNAIQGAISEFAIAATVFVFTAVYIFTDREKINAYVRSKLPPRFTPLTSALMQNLRGVMYGAIYATLVTQTIKTVIILALNLMFQVPLAVVLALVSFVIGFFPIVGSWSVYVPVAGWLLIFGDNPTGAIVVLLVGFFVNTLYISTYIRPKVAAQRSGVLNFYWMFVGLVTGVYTFGLPGILIGPIVIGLLKAIIDTITSHEPWQRLDADEVADDDAGAPAPVRA